MATSIYHHHRFSRAILKKFRKTEATFTIELHPDYWRFQGHDDDLTYDGPMRFFLESLRSQSIPTGLLPLIFSTENKVKLYDGCVIVEIHDFRPTSSAETSAGPSTRRSSTLKKLQGDDHFSRNVFLKNVAKAATMTSEPSLSFPQFRPNKNADSSLGSTTSGTGFTRSRCIMKPDPSTMWEQIVYLNQTYGEETWDDQAALALEARILAAISPPLLLDPSPVLPFRIANLSSSLTAPARPFMSPTGDFIPRSQRQGINADDDSERAKPVEKTRAMEKSRMKVDFDRDMLLVGERDAAMVEMEKSIPKHNRIEFLNRHIGFFRLRHPKADIPPELLARNGQPMPVSNGMTENGVNGYGNGDIQQGGNGQMNGDDSNAVPAPKKPKKKKAAAAAAAAAAAVAAAAAEAALEASKAEAEARANDEKPKTKSKKKKETNATVVGLGKGKKRAADEMSVANSDVGVADDDADKKAPSKKKKKVPVQPPTPVVVEPVQEASKKKVKKPPVPTPQDASSSQLPDVNAISQMPFNGVPNASFGADMSNVPQLTQEQLEQMAAQYANVSNQSFAMPTLPVGNIQMQADPLAPAMDFTAQVGQGGDTSDSDALAAFIAGLASSAGPDLQMSSRVPGGSRAPPGQ